MGVRVSELVDVAVVVAVWEKVGYADGRRSDVTTGTDALEVTTPSPGKNEYTNATPSMVAFHTGVAVAQQTLVFNGQPLTSAQQRLDAAGVRDGDLVQLVVLRAPPPRVASAQPPAATRLLPDGSAADPVAFQARPAGRRECQCCA